MNLPRAARSIATRIVLIGVMVVVFGTITRYTALGHFLREDVSAVVASQQLALATFAAKDVEHKLVERKEVLENMARALPLELLQRPKALDAWLRERAQLQSLFSHGITAVRPDGAVIGQASATNPTQARLLEAARAGRWSVGSLETSPADGKALIPVAAPLRTAQGELVAVLVGRTAVTAPDFLNFSDRDRIGQGGGLLLVSSSDKVFLASTRADMVLKPTPPPGVNPLHDKAMEGYRGTGITQNAQGKEEISAMVSVPSANWFVVGRIPTSEALATVGRAQRYVATNSLVVLLIFILVAVTSLNYVFRPLRSAADHADRMTRGEAPLEPLKVVRDDEVGELTAAFNRLLAKLEQSQRQMVHMAHHDALTGLPNRTLLADRLHQTLARAQRMGECVGLLYLDLDKFKPINDQHGHDVGDTVLVKVALRLGAVLRESDTLARVGGDEFVIILGSLNTPEREQALVAAQTVAQKCIDAIAPASDPHHELFGVCLSIGIAVEQAPCEAGALQTAADNAMYLAKQRGGSIYCVAPAISASA
ncbi:MAG: diguanylate cyclase [Rhodoferax sp.]|nr:MAG: diguanylate cyclase [Rhodoferax sp.]